ncbi:membrane protein insertase YidC [uncultured Nocardioides sp.]|uniref:membrane protein insertase YidC n=1 Tax=uncultured Nocardioides sp. TaxID=198441 RepID=UPI0026371E9C|nr:membrane protein insertase YidC [uncultured Nocardioides sp.]
MIEFFSAIGGFIMTPLYYVVSFIMVGFHTVLSTFLDPAGGASWLLSIVGLTIVIRAALIPLFVKQIRSSRNMQLIQPQIRELQKKYGHDRERFAQESMKLYKETGTNPFASCLPLLVQMPIFFALFRMIDRASKGQPRGVLDAVQAEQFGNADLFGSIPIAGTLVNPEPGGIEVRILAVVLVLAMTATTFLTQRQLMSKNMPPEALNGPYARQQKMLLYVLPPVFAIGGVAFPIGVLVYWTTTNLWTMGQQFYIIRRNPAPGTPAFKAKEEREREKKLRKGGVVDPVTETGGTTTAVVESDAPAPGSPTGRQQPKRQTRSERTRTSANAPKPSASTPPRKHPQKSKKRR